MITWNRAGFSVCEIDGEMVKSLRTRKWNMILCNDAGFSVNEIDGDWELKGMK